MNLMKYKDYVAEIQIDQKAGLLAGKVLNLKDVITFEGKTVEEVIQAFHSEVDKYLTHCEESGDVPDKPFSGHLPFRTTPERHHNIFIAARLAGAKSINAWMDETLAEAAAGVMRQHTQVGDDIAQGGTQVLPGSRRIILRPRLTDLAGIEVTPKLSDRPTAEDEEVLLEARD
jgi:predicted HicB family RNase H-like nuclease